MRVGLLTGGGDCPGLNAVIRAIVQRIHNAGGSCVGFLEGWRGLVRGQAIDLPVAETDGIIARGGTILGVSRTNPYKNAETDIPSLQENFAKFDLDALIAIGGDDTLGVANRLARDFKMPMVGVPKAIDNDLAITDFTFGFDTAVNVVIEAIDRLRTTSESHRRIMVVETMGRRAGWIACFSGIAAAADYILVPEVPIQIEHCIEVLKRRRAEGKNYGIVVAAEGSRFPDDAEPIHNPRHDRSSVGQLGGVGTLIAERIEHATGIETRSVVLGHIQRGGPPSAYDRVLATRFGAAAADLALRSRFGTLVALRGTQIVEAPLSEAIANQKTLDLSIYREATTFFPQ